MISTASLSRARHYRTHSNRYFRQRSLLITFHCKSTLLPAKRLLPPRKRMSSLNLSLLKVAVVIVGEEKEEEAEFEKMAVTLRLFF